MKRTLLFFAIISITYSMHAQWKYQEINNPFDGVTRKVYIKGKAISSSSYNPTLVITKSFKTNTIDIQIKDVDKFCSERICSPEIVFKIQGGNDSIYFKALGDYKDKFTWRIPNWKVTEINQLLELIKNNYKLYIRLFNFEFSQEKINDYEFSLKGSAKAIQYLMGED